MTKIGTEDVLQRTDPDPAASREPWSSTRRELLRRSVGAAVLVAAPRFLQGNAWASTNAATTTAPYFVFGTPDPSNADDPSLLVGQNGSPTLRAQNLVTPPLRSLDRSRLVLVGVEESNNSAAIALTVLDTATGEIAAAGTLILADIPDSVILVVPAITPAADVVCLAIAVTTPSNWQNLTKLNPLTGQVEQRRVATWVSSHAIAFFDTTRQTFAGPFFLKNAPSLANCNVAATAKDFCLWAMTEPAAVPPPTPTPRLSIFPLGSGTPRLVTEAPSIWPVNGEPTAALQGGSFARLVGGTTLEVYAPRTGSLRSQAYAVLDNTQTRPTRARMEQLPNGSLFISNPALGRALVVDGANPGAPRASLAHEPRAFMARSSVPQAQLSDDGRTFYALGPDGGVGAYSIASGQIQETVAQGSQFTGLYRLSSGGLAATSETAPKLTFFNQDLSPAGTADTTFYIDGVF